MRRLWRMASGMSRNSAAIAAGGFRWRSTLASSRRPAWSRVVPRRMQVRTSRSGRPSGAATRAARGLEEARRAVDAARVGERQRVVAERCGTLDQILRQRGAGEEAERAPAAQLDVVGYRCHGFPSGDHDDMTMT